MDFSRLVFGLMYRLGFTPWDGHQLAARMRELAQTPTGTKRALDVGCGTGDASIHLAQRGWEVTGVDFVESALARARRKASAAGVPIRFVRADVTHLSSAGIGEVFQLIIDGGCLHGLSDEGREAYVREITKVSAPGARLLLLGFAEGKRRGPRGFNRPEIERRFSQDWQLLSAGVDEAASNMPDDPIYVYDLRRKT